MHIILFLVGEQPLGLTADLVLVKREFETGRGGLLSFSFGLRTTALHAERQMMWS